MVVVSLTVGFPWAAQLQPLEKVKTGHSSEKLVIHPENDCFMMNCDMIHKYGNDLRRRNVIT